MEDLNNYITNKDFSNIMPTNRNDIDLWCDIIAKSFNDSKYKQTITIGNDDCLWTKHTVNLLMKKISKAIYNKADIYELTKDELSKIGKSLEKYLSNQQLMISFLNYNEFLEKKEQEEKRKEEYKKFKNDMSPEDRKKYDIAFGE
jgi:hypothetical protein